MSYRKRSYGGLARYNGAKITIAASKHLYSETFLSVLVVRDGIIWHDYTVILLLISENAIILLFISYSIYFFIRRAP